MSKEIETYNPTEESVVVYRSADNAVQLDVQLADETVWLTQAQMAMLFDSTKQNVSLHINNIYKEGELSKEATVKDYLTVQNEGGRQITRRVLYYNLDGRQKTLRFHAIKPRVNRRVKRQNIITLTIE